MVTVPSILGILFFRDFPPSPPSSSSGAERDDFLSSIRGVVRQGPFIVLLCTISPGYNLFILLLFYCPCCCSCSCVYYFSKKKKNRIWCCDCCLFSCRRFSSWPGLSSLLPPLSSLFLSFYLFFFFFFFFRVTQKNYQDWWEWCWC